MVYPQQAIPYGPPLVAFYDMQQRTRRFNSTHPETAGRGVRVGVAMGKWWGEGWGAGGVGVGECGREGRGGGEV